LPLVGSLKTLKLEFYGDKPTKCAMIEEQIEEEILAVWPDDRAGPIDGAATRSQLDGVLQRRSGLRWPGRLEAEPGHVPMDLPDVRAVTDGLPSATAAFRAREVAHAPTSRAE
jgi:hypothetical protein